MKTKFRKRLAALALITALLIPATGFAAGPSEVSCEGVAALVDVVSRGAADLDCDYDYPTP